MRWPVGDAQAVLVGDVQRLALGHVPRDAVVAATGEGTLQVLHHGLHHRGIDAHPRQLRELLGVDIRTGAAEQLPDELLELLLGALLALAVGLCHFSRLSAGS